MTSEAKYERRKLVDPVAIATFVLGARAIFTVLRDDVRYTYRVIRAEGESENRPWFVEVLTGPNNTRDFTYVGCVFPDTIPDYYHDVESRVGDKAGSVELYRWLLSQVTGDGSELTKAEVWHEGRCCCCGRRLTVPESIESGIGPICKDRGGF